MILCLLPIPKKIFKSKTTKTNKGTKSREESREEEREQEK